MYFCINFIGTVWEEFARHEGLCLLGREKGKDKCTEKDLTWEECNSGLVHICLKREIFICEVEKKHPNLL